MTQGARNTRKPKVSAQQPTNKLSMSEWMEQRGLNGDREFEIGGTWFKFVRAATSEQLAAFAKAREAGDLVGLMAAFLVDSGEFETLKAAVARAKQPISAKDEQEYLTAIVNFLIAGDAGESSAS